MPLPTSISAVTADVSTAAVTTGRCYYWLAQLMRWKNAYGTMALGVFLALAAANLAAYKYLARPAAVASTAGAEAEAGARRVVIAAALNYGLTRFAHFVVPLRKVYSGDIVVFVGSDLPPDVIEFCLTHRVQLMALPEQPGLAIEPALGRYAGYAQVCRRYEWCFATDFKDVVFQADPFASAPRDYDLVLAEEYAEVTIASCPWNSRWISSCFGTEVLLQIGHRPIICSGTIMGTPRGFNELESLIMQHATQDAKSCIEMNGVDQGLVNYLYYADNLHSRDTYYVGAATAIAQPRGQGIVNTVGYMPGNVTTLDLQNKAGLVTNDDGTVAAVVHQYNRVPLLHGLAKRLSWVPPSTGLKGLKYSIIQLFSRK